MTEAINTAPDAAVQIRPATFLMAGGGTGGHVIPALAVARELQARGHAVRFIGTQRGLEATLVPAAGFPIDWIVIGGLNRVGLTRSLQSVTELPLSVWQASRVLDRTRPAAVFSMGGFVAGPVLLAALWKRIPVVAMEPNAIPGFTHRKFARFIARALVGFPETAAWFPGRGTEVTGLPVRSKFFEIPPKPLGDPFTVLITGGSQGSRTLNRGAEESWPLWATVSGGPSIRLIHQTGLIPFEQLAAKFKAANVPGEIHPFIKDMPAAFAEADLIVSRAGMGAVSELAAAGKPSILIPLPTASDQHQLRNAQALERAGATRIVLDVDWNGQRFVDEVMSLLREPGRLERMGTAARTFAKPDAAQRAATVLESLIPPG
ncbi:MAG: undecaprenyldiphospho-muramoylpentapeptide beta-N-acetylglucosaminyltransferase [Acidobacteriota bacterium]